MKKCIWIFRNLFMVVMVFISVLPAWFEWYLMHLVRNTDYALYRGSVRINCIQRYQELSPRLHVVSYAIVQYLMPILLLLIVMCCLYLGNSPARLAVWASAVLFTILLIILCLTWVPYYSMPGKMRYMSFLGLLSRYTVPYSIRRGGIGGAQLALLFTPIIAILYRGFKRRKKSR